MRFPRSSSLFFFLGIVALYGYGCGGATEPTVLPPPPDYNLVTYDGRPLPVETRAIIANPTQPGGPSYRCSDQLTAINLQFAASGAFTRRESRVLVCDNGRPDELSSSSITGTYVRTAVDIEMRADTPDGRSLTFGRFSNDSLFVDRQELHFGSTPLMVKRTLLVFVASQ
jgi:hypothetical protein